ncbi:restriction endonuclease subunit S [Paraglaciecola chathamensis]|uniref:restriction endonuclease subunit S n=1 Tax=Paraglaciecola chathamensis TaxID=368405 RepID=UPI00270B4BB3|nr:restriction endonuclease subunit S [Paraglaciecola chathamensis]MDO6559764.1 restriction endonuclease subunit S [Paraglaciecola chathamensis]
MSWPKVKLSELISLTGGHAFKSGDFEESGIPLIRIGTANSGVFKTTDFVYLPNDYETKYSKYLVKPKDLLITLTGTVGKGDYGNVCEASDTYTAYLLNQRVARVNITSNNLFKRYLYLYLATPEVKRSLTSLSRGVRQANIKNDDILDLEIPLPPLEEQKRIAAILDKADSVRRKRQQAINLADDFLRSVFLDMFGDPVANPKGWEVKPMKNLITIQGGYAFKSGDFGKVGIPVVKIGNANKLGFTTKGVAFIEPKDPSNLKKYELYAGDLLMSLTGTVGKDDYANVTEVTNEYEIYYLNQRVAKITVNESEISKNYLKFFLAEPQIKGEITKNNRGVRQANIGNADIYGLNVPVPGDRALIKFDSIVKQVKKMSIKTAKAPEYSESFFNSLSQKAFSGKL